MSFSSIAMQQRSKEAKTLNFILCYSLVASLALHVAVLAIVYFLPQAFSSKKEPIEVEIIYAPTPQNPKLLPEKKEVTSHNQSEVKVNPQKSSSATSPVHKFSESSKMQSEQQQSPRNTETTGKIWSDDSTKSVVIESPTQKSSNSKPTKIPPKEVSSKLEETPVKPAQSSSVEQTNVSTSKNVASVRQPQEIGGQSREKLTQVLRGLKNPRNPQEDAGNMPNLGNSGGIGDRGNIPVNSAIKVGSSNGVGTSVGTSSRSVSGSGNRLGNGQASVSGNSNGQKNSSGDSSATGVGTSVSSSSISVSGSGNRLGNGQASVTGNSNGQKNSSGGNGNGRAACSDCRTNYPESARRRGIEGRVEVAVDTDEKGHVTNVHLAHSSGNRDLDEETLRQAREWKLKPTTGGRQGVAIATEYALEGSRHYRELQERKKHRQQSEQQATESVPIRKRRLTSGILTDVPSETINKQRQESAPSYQEPATRRAQAVLGRRLRHQNGEDDSHRESVAPTTRRQTQEATSNRGALKESPIHQQAQESKPASQQRLRDSLRRFRLQSQSQEAPVSIPSSTDHK